jgi:hypothetical protein
MCRTRRQSLLGEFAALGPPTGGAGSAAVVPGSCAPRTPIASAAVAIVIGGMHG